MNPSPQVTQTAGQLADRRTTPDRRVGVRRTSDLTGWARVLGEALTDQGNDQ